MDAKYGMSSFGIKIYINKIAVNNQRGKQTMLQVVEKEAYLLECNWTASDRTHQCLWNHQSTRTGFSIKYHNTIWLKACSKHNKFSTWTVCLCVFSISLHPRWILMKTAGQTVVKGVVIHWHWGCIVGLSVGGALRGDGNGWWQFSWWSWCANKHIESMVVGFMGIVG